MTTAIIGFAGMTHLGINSAVAAAEKGFKVVCFDPDQSRINQLSSKNLHVVEPDLPELLDKNWGNIKFSAKPADLAACNVVYIAPDVPTDDLGQSDLGPIGKLIDQVDAVLRSDCVMVLLSQVPPGYTRGRVKAGRLLHYQVETLIFGRAMERALYPERFIVGCADPMKPLPSAFVQFLGSFGCPILSMRYESAELAKISINMCLVASVSVANTMAELCEKVGADWAEIIPSLKLDKRIGQHAYLAPGLGIAGGNLERDLATVCRLADEKGTDAGVVRAWIANSRHRRDWVLRTLHSQVIAKTPDPTIAVLGLSYKQDTASTKNSPSLALIKNLHPFALQVFDPLVPASVLDHPKVTGAPSALEACASADALVIMTPWKRFGELDPAQIAKKLHGKIILDPYAVLKSTECRGAGLDYHTLGIASYASVGC
jgi:UDPglucose 6-dehydrogenase